MSVLSNLLDDDHKNLLNQLFIKDDKGQYKITSFKSISQHESVSKIKESIQVFSDIKELYNGLFSIIESLGLSLNTWRSYAYLVEKFRSYDLLRKENTTLKYLYCTAFIIHQCNYRQDNFVKICLNAQNRLNNRFKQFEKEWFYQKREVQEELINMSKKKVNTYQQQYEKTKEILAQETLSSDEKIRQMNLMIQEHELAIQEFDQKWEELKLDEYKLSEKSLYHEFLPTQYTYLNQRIGQILKILEFDKESSDPDLLEAIEHFKQMKSTAFCHQIKDMFDFPNQCLKENGKIHIQYTKSLFFLKICDAIRAGKLNLMHSYKYRSIENYLIPLKEWKKHKTDILQNTNLSLFEDTHIVLQELEKGLNKQYEVTNDHYLKGKNPHLKIKSTPLIDTPGAYNPQDDLVSDLLEPFHYVSIQNVLLSVDKHTHFLESFQHQSKSSSSSRPNLQTLIAAVMSYGCNIGVHKMGKISQGVNIHTLQNTVQWYFHQECIEEANERIIKLTKSLPIYQLFKQDMLQHTSSDGQKYNMAVESLNANYSFKYFGKEKGVSVYSFVDEGILTFYSTVISASEREASYVLDGLLHNDLYWEEEKEWMHHTDTHGQSEVLFAMTNLLGISLSPRIKSLNTVTLYGLKKPSEYKETNYIFIPQKTINISKVEKEWDNILRFMATIKTKRTTASILLNRLSSYAKQHPLYQALQELGRIYRSMYVLKYYDELELRQSTVGMLNKMERSNQFAKAIFFDNNQKIRQELKEEQDVAINCRVLIQNAIILWNCLQLSNLLLHTENEEDKQEMINIIKAGSASTWQHVNLQGIYQFKTPKSSELYFSKIDDFFKMNL